MDQKTLLEMLLVWLPARVRTLGVLRSGACRYADHLQTPPQPNDHTSKSTCNPEVSRHVPPCLACSTWCVVFL